MNQAREVIKKVFGKEGLKALSYLEGLNHENKKMPLIINGGAGTGKSTLLTLISMALSNGESTVMNYEYRTKAGMIKHIQESNLILIELDNSDYLTEEKIKLLIKLANGKPIVITGNFTSEAICHHKFITLSHEHFSDENKTLIYKVLGR
ncbi:hypothetical protein MMG00_09865 [Ignatzschineria rhizosphaerae]|uniref:AAA+ ATPase domain-containing protein n=1 Tax=Ignatzschineria rhizosphaerae TaxID=2923279 RepID=A0ABY3X181_9GAMM|nr:hypothetical protein [Ignatzschineria rhizosphaerae]UNM95526.1 hypothetical protein MMG00_09865 [Ignatzschineria rhizosphaerae]